MPQQQEMRPLTLESKLGLANSAQLAEAEERITKKRALELFDQGLLDAFAVGTYRSLAQIHARLFGDIYDFAGKTRTQNIAKGTFRFAPVMFLEAALDLIDDMPQGSFEEIIAKYVEMNIAHPFREGNGRSTRVWLDAILRKELGMVVDWSRVSKEDYMRAMERSPVWDLEIRTILKAALTDRIADREVYMEGLNASWTYEEYDMFKAAELDTEET